MINGKPVPFLDEKTLATVEYDIVIVGGVNVSMAAVLKDAARLGLDKDKIVLDRTICVPGFTLEKYKQLRHSQLSIISLVCWGGLAYHLFGLPFTSPTINMFFEEDDFLKLLHDPHHYFDKELRFYKMKSTETEKNIYPIFLLGDIQASMSHYKDVDKAREDWERRRLKINWFNTLVMMFTEKREVLEEFDRLPYAKKVCFVPFKTDLNSGFYIDPTLPPKRAFWTISNDTARNFVQWYDMWDMLLYGKKTPLKNF